VTQKQFQIGHNFFNSKPVDVAFYIVATPIGNLGDITIRALEILSSVDVIACEDTRTSKKLLDRYGIKTPLIAYHEHNAEHATKILVQKLDDGQSVALISDAGTPLISDPGFRIVNAVSQAGHRSVPIPGASSLLASLMASGLPTDQFMFAGFLPSKEKARKDRLAEFKSQNMTLVFFESPHRIKAALGDAVEVFGSDTQASICRELTKTHEEFARASLADLYHQFSSRTIKGEIVFVIYNKVAERSFDDRHLAEILDQLPKDMPTNQAAALIAKLTLRPKKQIYQLLLEMKKQNEG